MDAGQAAAQVKAKGDGMAGVHLSTALCWRRRTEPWGGRRNVRRSLRCDVRSPDHSVACWEKAPVPDKIPRSSEARAMAHRPREGCGERGNGTAMTGH